MSKAAAKKIPYKCMVKPYDWSLHCARTHTPMKGCTETRATTRHRHVNTTAPPKHHNGTVTTLECYFQKTTRFEVHYMECQVQVGA
ncbi:hypothetical protein EMCRGX_G027503 [Ephydatia muelleri]